MTPDIRPGPRAQDPDSEEPPATPTSEDRRVPRTSQGRPLGCTRPHGQACARRQMGAGALTGCGAQPWGGMPPLTQSG